MYLAGYAVESLLKSKLMSTFGCRTLRELDDESKARNLIGVGTTIYTHQFEILLRAAGGLERLRNDRRLWPQFNIVNRWVPAWRYDPDQSTPEEAEDFLAALDQILRWIRFSL